MTKLVLSYAILSLEQLGYEQAKSKPLSFARQLGDLTVTCRLTETEGFVTGSFLMSVSSDGETLQAKASVPLQTVPDIRNAEIRLFDDLTTQIAEQTELALIAYRARGLQLSDLAVSVAHSMIEAVRR